MMDQPPTYLILGHITEDLINGGYRLGGTAAYAARTARAFGLTVRLITSSSQSLDLSPLEGVEFHLIPSDQSTVFNNQMTPGGRVQHVLSRARSLDPTSVPPEWSGSDIVHLAPVADEIDEKLIQTFANRTCYLTPQGMIRKWDREGVVKLQSWRRLLEPLRSADAAVLSLEDLQGELEVGPALVDSCPCVVVTAGSGGAHLFTEEGSEHIPAVEVVEVDSTGAGDIFAAAFFILLHRGYRPEQALVMANALAGRSVTRSGLASTPQEDEVQSMLGAWTD